MSKNKLIILGFIATFFLSTVSGAVFGFFGVMEITQRSEIMERLGYSTEQGDVVPGREKVIKISEENAVIDVVDKVSPAVVSVIVSKDLPILERYYANPFGDDEMFKEFFGDDFSDFFGFGAPQYRQKGTEKKEIGGGTGFIVSSDGYIVTNKHVVYDEDAEYTVLMNDENKYEAEVLARDPLSDLAILKIEGNDFPVVEIGGSSDLKVGQTVIAIGNALGEFRNTVSTGVISGLSRSIIAGGSGVGSEKLVGLIQSDASINPGNSGGPLLNIRGQVIGINTAMAQGAENIGFAIAIDEVKETIQSVRDNGRIIRPWLGVRYALVDDQVKKDNNLEVGYGAIVVRGEKRTDLAVIPGSPADKAGLVENDIILEVNGEKITAENNLAKIIGAHKPGDELKIKVLHKGEEVEVKVVLEEMK